MTPFSLYRFLAFLTGKKHNTVKQHFNRYGIKPDDKVAILSYILKHSFKK